MRICKKCNQEKPLEDFTGPKSACLECRKKARKATLAKHAEKNKAKCKQWYYDNRERVLEEQKAKYASNEEYRANKRASNAKWDEANKEYKRAKDREYWNKHKDLINAERRDQRKPLDEKEKLAKSLYMKEYYKDNKEYILDRNKEYQRNNREASYIRRDKWEKRNPEKAKETRNRSVAEWKDKNPDKLKAQSKLQKAVQMGKVIKPNMCSWCEQEQSSSNIIGHHHDYSKPLDVIWLCRKCHGRIHRKA